MMFLLQFLAYVPCEVVIMPIQTIIFLVLWKRGVKTMQVNINNEKKYIDIWLAHGDSPVNIGTYIARYPTYNISIFHSGNENLVDTIALLLQFNR